jgi:hypothetical protein
MSFSIKYKEFFRINIFHRYFLNKGTDTFESMTPVNRDKQLDSYDHRIFFDVQPTPETVSRMNGYKLVFNKAAKGISVWGQVSESNHLKPYIDIDDFLSFTFLIGLKDPRFLNYTSLNPKDAMKVYYFSNKLPDSEPETFPLINLSGTSDFIDERYILSPVSVTQELKIIPAGMRKNLFGIIRIFIKGENNTMHITDGQGDIPATPKVFEISFDNRKTFWRYIFNSDQTVVPVDGVTLENGDARILITKNLMPLTNQGFIPVKKGDIELPNAGISAIKPDPLSNNIFSEIFM